MKRRIDPLTLKTRGEIIFTINCVEDPLRVHQIVYDIRRNNFLLSTVSRYSSLWLKRKPKKKKTPTLLFNFYLDSQTLLVLLLRQGGLSGRGRFENLVHYILGWPSRREGHFDPSPRRLLREYNFPANDGVLKAEKKKGKAGMKILGYLYDRAGHAGRQPSETEQILRDNKQQNKIEKKNIYLL